MREIKFRAWDKVLQEMFIPIFSGSVGENINQKIENIRNDWELMQFTGLKDKNGKEIYEGDIVRRKSKYDYRRGEYEVKYPEDFSGFSLYNLDKSRWREKTDGSEPDGWDGILGSQGSPTTELEVIGNIYENPELLK